MYFEDQNNQQEMYLDSTQQIQQQQPQQHTVCQIQSRYPKRNRKKLPQSEKANRHNTKTITQKEKTVPNIQSIQIKKRNQQDKNQETFDAKKTANMDEKQNKNIFLLSQTQKDKINSILPPGYFLIAVNEFNSMRQSQDKESFNYPRKRYKFQQAVQGSSNNLNRKARNKRQLSNLQITKPCLPNEHQVKSMQKQACQLRTLRSKTSLVKQQKIDQRNIVRLVFELFVSHVCFAVLQSNISRKYKIRKIIKTIEHNLKHGYSISSFKKDLSSIFDIYYESSNIQQGQLNQIRQYQRQIDTATQNYKAIGISNHDQPQGQTNQTKQTKANKQLKQNKQSSTAQSQNNYKKNNKKVLAKKDQIAKNNQVLFSRIQSTVKSVLKQMVNQVAQILQQPKSTQKIVKIFSLKQKVKLGKNLRNLKNKDLISFCLKFGNDDKQYLSFDFDLISTANNKLTQMEIFITKALKQCGKQYEDISDCQQFDDFVISDQ